MSTVHQQKLLDHTHLHSRNAGVNTGLRLAYSDQPHSLSPQLYLMSKNLSTQIPDEIDHFLQVQDEELRRRLAEKRQGQNYALLEAAEVSVSRWLKEKETEAEKAVWRKSELEARAAQLRTEAEEWQARATAQEAEAVSLQGQLQEAMVSSGGGDMEDAESAYGDPERVVVVASGPGCKVCGKRVSSVVLLPCRHVCVCGECEGVVLACPLCLSMRTSSIEVYMT